MAPALTGSLTVPAHPAGAAMAELTPPVHFFHRDPIVGGSFVADTMKHLMSSSDEIKKKKATVEETSRALMKETQAIANVAMDVKETSKAYVFTADLPGLTRDEVQVHVEKGNVLVISGERRRESKVEGDHFHQTERSTGKFMRRFTLPFVAQLEKLEVQADHGVFKIIVPKSAPEEPEETKADA